MGDHYILERYLSNSLDDDDGDQFVDDFKVVQTVMYTDKVPQWTEQDVSTWLKKIGFADFCDIFRQVGVDGDILLTLKDSCMKEDLEMTNGILRKRFQRELRNLKKNTDYSCIPGGDEIATWLTGINQDFREFTYNLYSKDMSVESMMELSKEDLIDMLKAAGVDNIVHQHRIYEAVLREQEHSFQSYGPNSPEQSESSLLSEVTGNVMSSDVYITFARDAGPELASLIRMQLELAGFSVFLADNQHQSLAPRNTKMIQNAKHFVLVLVPGALDSCKLSPNCSDKIKDEIQTALDAGSNIVPVVADFQWPSSEELDPEVREVAYFNNVRWVHEYQDECIRKLIRFLGGGNLLKPDSPFKGRSLARSRRSSGFSTPLSGPSRRPSEAPLSTSLLSSLLNVPRPLRRSNVSLVSCDSGLDTLIN